MNTDNHQTLREIYERCDVSNNRTVNPMSYDEFEAAIRAAFERAVPIDYRPEGYDINACLLHQKYTSSCAGCQRQKSRRLAFIEFKSNIEKEVFGRK